MAETTGARGVAAVLDVTEQRLVRDLVARARAAQAEFETFDQARTDAVVAGVAWAGYGNAERLGRMAWEESRIGRLEDKISKLRRKTKGTMRDLKGAPSVGVVEVDRARGLVKIAKPIGVVGAFVPLTNPAATPVHNMMCVLKGRNAIIISPHPSGEKTCLELVRLVHEELRKVGAPLDVVQVMRIPEGVNSRALRDELMRQVDLVVVTGGQNNVRSAYRSGRPALSAGTGNAVVVVDETADLADAAAKVARSKTYDYATSCSSENALVIERGVYDRMVALLREQGGYLCSPEEKAQLQAAMWQDGVINREIVARPPARIAEVAGLASPAAREAKFFMVEETGWGKAYPFSGEKLSVVLTLYRYDRFDDAVNAVVGILDYQGKGHSCGIHTEDDAHVRRLAEDVRVKVGRVLVNQAHCFGNGGSFDNGLKFTLTLACGIWGGDSINENLTYHHFLNYTWVSRPIPPAEPTDEELWGDYIRTYGGR
jgi:sulfoacetaldehyde dehydrogenase